MRPRASVLARAFLAVGSVSIVVASIVGGGFAAAVFAVVVALFPVALIAIGASRRGRLGRVGGVLVGLAVLLAGSAAFLVVVRPMGWILGMPAATAAMLVGLGLLPLLLVAWGYAATFPREGPTARSD